MTVLRHIPKVVDLPQSLKNDIQREATKTKKSKNDDEDEDDEQEDEEEDEEDDFEECNLTERSKDFTYLKMDLPKKEQPTYHEHKLAVILSTLAANNHFPKTHSKETQMVKVGVEKHMQCPERVKLMPLLQFCYAVLCGEEERIFTFEDYNRIKEQNPPPPVEDEDKKKKKKKKKDVHETFLSEEDLLDDDGVSFFEVAKEIDPDDKHAHDKFTSYYEEESSSFNEDPHIGVSPNVDGPFRAFVFYLKVKGVKVDKKGQQPFYRWKTDENGWAPGFFNASFDWFYHVTMDSQYSAKDKAITITITQARELVN